MPYLDKEAQLKYQREWVAGRRRRYLEKHGPCIDCGSTDDLEFDHVEPKDKISHRIWSWSAKRIEAELEKCVVRCVVCHRIKTFSQLYGERLHGTAVMYSRGKCRCVSCRLAKSAENSYYRGVAQLVELSALNR